MDVCSVGFYTLFQNTWDQRPTLAAPGWDILKTALDVYFLVVATKTSHPSYAREGLGRFEISMVLDVYVMVQL